MVLLNNIMLFAFADDTTGQAGWAVAEIRIHLWIIFFSAIQPSGHHLPVYNTVLESSLLLVYITPNIKN